MRVWCPNRKVLKSEVGRRREINPRQGGCRASRYCCNDVLVFTASNHIRLRSLDPRVQKKRERLSELELLLATVAGLLLSWSVSLHGLLLVVERKSVVYVMASDMHSLD